MNNKIIAIIASMIASGKIAIANQELHGVPDSTGRSVGSFVIIQPSVAEFGQRMCDSPSYRRKRNRRMRGANGGALPKKYRRGK